MRRDELMNVKTGGAHSNHCRVKGSGKHVVLNKYFVVVYTTSRTKIMK
jgi:hypothetical protein